MSEEGTDEQRETQETGEQGGDESAEKGPPEDIENDPAYNPEDENLKGIKGG